MQTALCDSQDSVLVVVDIQVRLAAAMPQEERARVVRNAGVLSTAAGLLGIPVLATEQYPRGLGPTDETVLQKLPTGCGILEKTCFACTGSKEFLDTLAALRRRQVVLTGMESHVCVLQTAFGLMREGYAVFVAEDAVCSRNPVHHRNALERMRAGAVITNTESVLFEWLRDARHEQFKAISALIK